MGPPFNFAQAAQLALQAGVTRRVATLHERSRSRPSRSIRRGGACSSRAVWPCRPTSRRRRAHGAAHREPAPPSAGRAERRDASCGRPAHLARLGQGGGAGRVPVHAGGSAGAATACPGTAPVPSPKPPPRLGLGSAAAPRAVRPHRRDPGAGGSRRAPALVAGTSAGSWSRRSTRRARPARSSRPGRRDGRGDDRRLVVPRPRPAARRGAGAFRARALPGGPSSR